VHRELLGAVRRQAGLLGGVLALLEVEVGKRISVKATGSKTGYTGETRTSVATAKVVK